MSMQKIEDFKRVFAEPRRQHFLGVVRYFTKNLVTLVRSFFPILAGFALSDEIRSYSYTIALVVFGLVIVSAFVEYWRFHFYVDERAIIIKKGLFERERIAIPFDRIQALHLEQAAWQRLFGLTGLKIDTAGTNGSEVDLQALKLNEANLLRDGIMAARSGVSSTADEVTTGGQLLVSLNPKELFKVGLTQNHLRNGFIALGAVVALFQPLESLIGTWLSFFPDWVWSLFYWGWFLFIPLGVFLFIILSFLISVLGAVFKFYNLKAELHEKEIGLKAGLLQRFEYRIPLKKVQILEWRSNILRRLLHIETLRLLQASAQEQNESGKGLAMSVPGMSSRASSQIIDAVFSPWSKVKAKEVIRPSGYLKHRILLLRALGVVALMVAIDGWLATLLVMMFGMAWAIWSSNMVYQNTWLSASSEVCMIHSGWLRKKRSMFSFYQLQRVVIHQNVVMKKRGVAHITLATAAGNRSIRYLNEQDAFRLYNWSLYQVERSAHKGL